MNLSRPFSVLIAAAAVSALTFGCGANGGSEPSQPTAAVSLAVTRAPVAPTSHGIVKRVSDALSDVDLRADQRTQIEALAADAEARQASLIATRHDLGQLLATQVAAGTLDRDALSVKVSALADAMRANQPKDRAAFEALHDLLDSSQRADFVQAMKSNTVSDGAWGVAKAAIMHGGSNELGHGFGHGMRWADDLNLTDDQRTAVEAILHDAFGEHHGHHDMIGEGHHGSFHGGGHGKALLEAFQADTFSFDDVAPPKDIGAGAQEMATHIFDVVDKVMPILKDDQRALASKKILDHVEALPLARP